MERISFFDTKYRTLVILVYLFQLVATSVGIKFVTFVQKADLRVVLFEHRQNATETIQRLVFVRQ